MDVIQIQADHYLANQVKRSSPPEVGDGIAAFPLVAVKFSRNSRNENVTHSKGSGGDALAVGETAAAPVEVEDTEMVGVQVAVHVVDPEAEGRTPED